MPGECAPDLSKGHGNAVENAQGRNRQAALAPQSFALRLHDRGRARHVPVSVRVWEPYDGCRCEFTQRACPQLRVPAQGNSWRQITCGAAVGRRGNETEKETPQCEYTPKL